MEEEFLKKQNITKLDFKKNLIKFLFKKLKAVIQGNWLKMKCNYLTIRNILIAC